MSDVKNGPENITLQNPEKQNFKTWIVGNAFRWQCEALAEIQVRAPREVSEALTLAFENQKAGLAYPRLEPFRVAIEEFCEKQYVVRQGEAAGQELAICGAGPSLRETAPKWLPQMDQVWGCNSALTWLHQQGYKVTHGFTVDQTAHMVSEWMTAPDVGYLCASTVHPNLTDHLRNEGREVRFFHNYVGIDEPDVSYDGESMPFEDWIYSNLYPATVRLGSGLNAVTRAVDLAMFMGFKRITILGADCALRVRKPHPKDPKTGLPVVFGSPEHREWLEKDTEMHADGGNALASEASPLTYETVIDAGTPDRRVRPGHGRLWVTKPDMMITAQWLVNMKKALGPRLRIMGDTLPKALLGKNDQYLKDLPKLTSPDGKELLFSPGDVQAMYAENLEPANA